MQMEPSRFGNIRTGHEDPSLLRPTSGSSLILIEPDSESFRKSADLILWSIIDPRTSIAAFKEKFGRDSIPLDLLINQFCFETSSLHSLPVFISKYEDLNLTRQLQELAELFMISRIDVIKVLQAIEENLASTSEKELKSRIKLLISEGKETREEPKSWRTFLEEEELQKINSQCSTFLRFWGYDTNPLT
eukprot:TRINITY_DN511_c0_g1_i1.p1 TRINITY_DN511_c0_g1~~TRINITY_DN511_c0_g1_i1.p1  ORF type:complete len:190 (-),score=44.60 TRINITY_DN511_c0_g1_i1:90-659(-)